MSISSRSVLLIAAVWNVIDVALHYRIDQLEPLRVAGNVVVIATVLALLVFQSTRSRVCLCAGAATVFAILNLIWAINKGSLPLPAAILITITLLLIAWAVRLDLQSRGRDMGYGAPASD